MIFSIESDVIRSPIGPVIRQIAAPLQAWTIGYSNTGLVRIPPWSFQEDDTLSLFTVYPAVSGDHDKILDNFDQSLFMQVTPAGDLVWNVGTIKRVTVNGTDFVRGNPMPLGIRLDIEVTFASSNIIDTIGGRSDTGLNQYDGFIWNISMNGTTESRYYPVIVRSNTPPIDTFPMEETLSGSALHGVPEGFSPTWIPFPEVTLPPVLPLTLPVQLGA